MNLKNKTWRYVTVIVVVLIVLNPEMIELALFVDAVGLEMFLMLLEVQVLAIMGVFLSNRIKPAISSLKRLLKNSSLVGLLKKVQVESGYLVISIPTEASLMHLLVASAVISGVLGVRV